MATKTRFAENLERLAGLHGLSMKEVSAMSGVSESIISKWVRGDRSPGFDSALKIGALFEISADRLATATTLELLHPEIASEERFLAVEEKIAKFRGRPSNVVPIKRRQRGRG